MALSPQVELLRKVSTATVTLQLYKRGIKHSWMKGPVPLSMGQGRLVGPAFTLRFVPTREDLASPAHWGSPRSTRAAVEEMPPGSVAVVDARGITEAGCFGDLLVARMKVRGVAGLVTDGAVRDAAAIQGTELPVWSAGPSAPASVAALHFVGWQEPIGCGGVAVMPGDIIVADGDGAVVVPADLAEEVARDGAEQEAYEDWAQAEIGRGVPLPGLYPANEETRARYDEWRAEQGKTPR